MLNPDVPSYAEIESAVTRLHGRVRRTPVLEVEVPTPAGRRPVLLKLELHQHTGSFKVRGAFATVLSTSPWPAMLVAASGGNHGLAVSHVGRSLGIPTQVFVPRTAPAIKVDAITALGAEVTRVGATYAEALEASREAADRPGALALHAYDAHGTVAGQATLGVELAEQAPDVGAVLVAVGGGGLVSGVTLGLAAAGSRARVVAVEPEACPTMHRALEHGAPLDVVVGGVAADALGASRLGGIAFATAVAHQTRSVLVSDLDVVEARRWLWREARVAAEPAGATALAALMCGAHTPGDDERLCVVVCGGNADPAQLS